MASSGPERSHTRNSGRQSSPSGTERYPDRGREAGWAIIGIFLMLAIAALVYAKFFLMPVALAFLLALVFTPVRRFLERRHIASWATAIMVVGTLVVTLIAGIYMLSGPVRGWVNDSPQLINELNFKLRSLREPVEDVVEASERVKEIASSEDPAVQEVVVRQADFAGVVASTAPSVLAQAVLTLVLLFFVLASSDMFYEKIVHVMPTLSDKRTSMRIAFDIERKLSRYLFTITVINACLGAAIGLAMWAIGMPDPLLFAVMGFLFNFIPYLGAAAGVAIATAVGILSFDEPVYAAMAGGAYLMLTFFEGQFITPYFVGRSLKLNTVVVLLSITFWAWAWSVVGMLIAVPILVTIRTFCEHIPQLHALGEFLAARNVEVVETEHPPRDGEEAQSPQRAERVGRTEHAGRPERPERSDAEVSA